MKTSKTILNGLFGVVLAAAGTIALVATAQAGKLKNEAPGHVETNETTETHTTTTGTTPHVETPGHVDSKNHVDTAGHIDNRAVSKQRVSKHR
jgi:hypothetical protein